jgi:hypothetical protein
MRTIVDCPASQISTGVLSSEVTPTHRAQRAEGRERLTDGR